MIITFNSCNWFNPKIHCKNFDQKLLAWAPYSLNDTIEFTDSLNHHYQLIVRQTDLMHKTSYSKRADCGGCDDYWVIKISGKSDSLKMNASYRTHDQNNLTEEYLIECNGIRLSLYDYNSKIENLDSMKIKGQFFKNIKTVRSLDNNDIKIILSKNLGFLMIKFGNLELYNQKFVPVYEINLNSINYIETNCD